jgi:sigma-B regulation protein RsbU (phosphoserine phosphatase)
MMQTSALRMGSLIDNVLDFARGRLGGGLILEREAASDLDEMLRHIIAELQVGAIGKVFETDFRLDVPVRCDSRRIGQLFSNLLSNAVTHGKPGGRVRAAASSTTDLFELSVANQGEAIPPKTRARLFQPFARGLSRQHAQGLGLGLYICAEIAKAHGGALDVVSADGETRFTFRMALT